MSDIVSGLVPDLGTKVVELLAHCKARGYEFKAIAGVRDPLTQAKYWVQSRTPEAKQAQIDSFKKEGAPFLAKLLEMVSPPHGDHITNTPPGFSWHQWGEACDCAWMVNGKIDYSTTEKINGLNGYAVYAEEAKKIGLTAGAYWTDFKDWDHVQLRATDNPGDIYSAKEINDQMLKQFGKLYPDAIT
ncbi:M15 family metallopeptidase [Candidatus Haliotispira prima]|uniref:M15 family metallopeptidase n=1 Tax=Candidatus Haliotispira prima TaxID=3034016 RepID=A0ABY8MHB2_9SPIO|nr:M15 family metallopeptidase [Candidatus Haliotispira prima]